MSTIKPWINQSHLNNDLAFRRFFDHKKRPIGSVLHCDHLEYEF